MFSVLRINLSICHKLFIQELSCFTRYIASLCINQTSVIVSREGNKMIYNVNIHTLITFIYLH